MGRIFVVSEQDVEGRRERPTEDARVPFAQLRAHVDNVDWRQRTLLAGRASAREAGREL